MEKNASILLIDDHALFRSSVALVLSAGLPGVRTYEAGSLDEALRLEVEPALVLLDVQLRGVSGLEGIASLKRKWPEARIAVVSAFDVSEVIDEAVRRGAVAFISKAEKPEFMLRKVGAWLSEAPPTAAAPAATKVTERSLLTPRQCEVLDLLCQGLSNKMIGRRLNVSEHTVRGHVQAMLATLQVSSRSEAAFAARRLGLIR